MDTTASRPQWEEALERANLARFGHAQLKRELKAGRITFPRALLDVRAETLTVFDLAMAQKRWGRVKTLRLMKSALLLREDKRIGTLSDVQLRRLVTRYVKGDY